MEITDMNTSKHKNLPTDSAWKVFFQAKLGGLQVDSTVLLRADNAITALEDGKAWLSRMAQAEGWAWYQITGVKYEPHRG